MRRTIRVSGRLPLFLVATFLVALAPRAVCQILRPPATGESKTADYAPDMPSLIGQRSSELRGVIERFTTDRAALMRRYGVEYSPERRAALRAFVADWQAHLQEIRFETLSEDGRIDYLLLQNRLAHELKLVAREEKMIAESAPLLPFSAAITQLQESRRRMETIDPAATAKILDQLADEIERTSKAVEAGTKPDAGKDAIKPTKVNAYRAARVAESLRLTLEQWFKYYDGYDPMFTWWATVPYRRADESLKSYQKVLREKVIGVKPGEDEPIVGQPIGREEVIADLAYEMIPYTAEELIEVAQREMAWCDQEMRKASREMGYGDDWKAALEHVKSDYVAPGKQPDLTRDLLKEAVEFLNQHDLVTIPPMALDVWRIEMISPEQQKESPFFLGGEVLHVSYPTDTMSEEDKLMSMRGNNVHFSRATVFHELIPGHHLQDYMTQRYNAYRRAFITPFWIEGNAFYWETLFWDLGFARSPEDRIGMLFWRMHRAARIIFSLGFHLGTMTPAQCIDFLVDRVGHERANATAEVRRSFNGDYSPLYQAAYMIGGLQFRALHHELVDSGRMTNRQFHDSILKGGSMPLEMVRAMLANEPLARDYKPHWRSLAEVSGKQ
jgi:hypothetical protein